MVHLNIDPRSGVPVYRQVMDQFKYYIASGVLTAGSQLPSIRVLAQTLAVNPTTVVKAYNELQHEGVIELKHGKGVFVAEGDVRMSARQKEAALRPAARRLAVEASQLGVPRDAVVRIVEDELQHMERDAKKHAKGMSNA